MWVQGCRQLRGRRWRAHVGPVAVATWPARAAPDALASPGGPNGALRGRQRPARRRALAGNPWPRDRLRPKRKRNPRVTGAPQPHAAMKQRPGGRPRTRPGYAASAARRGAVAHPVARARARVTSSHGRAPRRCSGQVSFGRDDARGHHTQCVRPPATKLARTLGTTECGGQTRDVMSRTHARCVPAGWLLMAGTVLCPFDAGAADEDRGTTKVEEVTITGNPPRRWQGHRGGVPHGRGARGALRAARHARAREARRRQDHRLDGVRFRHGDRAHDPAGHAYAEAASRRSWLADKLLGFGSDS